MLFIILFYLFVFLLYMPLFMYMVLGGWIILKMSNILILFLMDTFLFMYFVTHDEIIYEDRKFSIEE
jgi:hypothetical protein